jgi:hypothetical protein
MPGFRDLGVALRAGDPWPDTREVASVLRLRRYAAAQRKVFSTHEACQVLDQLPQPFLQHQILRALCGAADPVPNALRRDGVLNRAGDFDVRLRYWGGLALVAPEGRDRSGRPPQTGSPVNLHGMAKAVHIDK